MSTTSNWRNRLRGLRNYQSQDFWAMVFARPLTILFLLPIADMKWVTPNRITILSILTKLTGIVMLVWWLDYIGGIVGALMLNLGLVFDNMDGTLARYRKSSTYIGYFLDKSLDIIGLCGLFFAIGIRAYLLRGHDIIDLLIPALGFAGAAVTAYSKWVAMRVMDDAEIKIRYRDGTLEEFAKSRLDPNRSEPPPERTLSDWIRWFIRAIISIKNFNEVDIFFFLLVAEIAGNEWIFTRGAAIFYALGLIFGPGFFYVRLRSYLKRRNLT